MIEFLEILRDANERRAVEWTGDGISKTPTDKASFSAEMLFRANELGGEVGEALNVVKKFARELNGWRGGKGETVTRAALSEELADVIICVDRLAALFNLPLQKIIELKFNETSEKYGLETRILLPSGGEES